MTQTWPIKTALLKVDQSEPVRILGLVLQLLEMRTFLSGIFKGDINLLMVIFPLQVLSKEEKTEKGSRGMEEDGFLMRSLEFLSLIMPEVLLIN